MSGWIALVNVDGAPIDRAFLERMTAAMAFRGPDTQEIWQNESRGNQRASVGLGAALLRTTDESAQERQPLTLDQRVWIVGEARVDGRAALIEKLRARGCAVSTDVPDIELILRAYTAWGDECVRHLIGDFAFVLWDETNQCLFGARDQVGVVPFFYARTQQGLICSNTLEILRLHPDVSDELNEQVIGDILTTGGNQSPDTTIYSAISSLPPAHTLRWSRGSLTVARYWEMQPANRYLTYSHPHDYAEHFRELLEKAVGDRLRTPRAAIQMSGGLDSTSVATVAKRTLEARGTSHELRVYTWVSNGAIKENERYYAEIAARAANIPITYLTLEDLWAAEQWRAHTLNPMPLATGGMATLRRASEHSRVLLSGLGADPLLKPDATHWMRRMRYRQFSELPKDAELHRASFRRRAPLYIRPNLRRWLKLRRDDGYYPSWLNPAFATQLHLRARWEQREQLRATRDVCTSMFTMHWTNEVSRFNPGATGLRIQMRYPYFDLRLIEYVSRVPAIPWFVNKHLLRSAMKGILPEPVRTRSKVNLGESAFHALMRQQGVPEWARGLAHEPTLARYVQPDRLEEALSSAARVDSSELDFVRRALLVADWLRQRRSAMSAAHTLIR